MATPISNETLNTASRTFCEATGDGEIKLTSNQCNSIKPFLQMGLEEMKSLGSKYPRAAKTYKKYSETLVKTIKTCTLPDTKTRVTHDLAREIIKKSAFGQMAKVCNNLNPSVLVAAPLGARIKNVEDGAGKKVPAAVVHNQTFLCDMKDGVCHLKMSKCPNSNYAYGYDTCPGGPYVSSRPKYYKQGQ